MLLHCKNLASSYIYQNCSKLSCSQTLRVKHKNKKAHSLNQVFSNTCGNIEA